MFERYTERARRVFFFARYEASQFGSTSIETEHFLLGLIREDKNLIKRFLRHAPPLETLRQEIEQRTTIREKVSTSIDLPLSDECKRTLAFAGEEAERLNHRHIGTEHLLLGILREEKSTAAKFLQEKGVELESIREQLAKALPERQPPHNIQSFPKRDFMVPDAATAKLIAEAIWNPVYGTVNVGGGSEVKSALIGGNWLVSAGPLFAYIRMVDGKVLAMGQRTEGTDV